MANDKVEVKAKKTDAYIAFEAVLEAYEKSNPAKYAAKKAELEAKLAALK